MSGKTSSGRSWPHFLGRLACLALVFWQTTGCHRYERVTSEEGLSIIRALYTACSTQNVERLSIVKSRIELARQRGDIQPKEAADFLEIVALAEDGHWDRSAREAYRFASDQVR